MKDSESITTILLQKPGYSTTGIGSIPPYSTFRIEIHLISINNAN